MDFQNLEELEKQREEQAQSYGRDRMLASLADRVVATPTAAMLRTGIRPQGLGLAEAVDADYRSKGDPVERQSKLLSAYREQKKMKADDDENDASSEKSVAFRKMLQDAKLPVSEGMSYAQMKEAFPLLSKRLDMSNEASRDAREFAQKKELMAYENSLKGGRRTVTNPLTGEQEIISAQGKQLPPDKVLAVNAGNAIPRTLDDVSATLENNKDIFGPVSGRAASANPWNEKAQTIDAQFRTAAQEFGRYMEGGVLRKEDEDKYRKMFPQLSDSPAVAKNKLDLVRRQLVLKQQSDVEALASSGYDTMGVSKRLSAPGLPSSISKPSGPGGDPTQALANSGGPKVGSVEDGHMFMGGDPRDPKNWVEAPNDK